VVPTILGFDPRLQFIHERDGLEVLWRTTLGDHGGTFNVAGAGVMTLSQAIRRAGRPSLPLPHPAAPWIGQALRRLGVADFSSEQIRFLSYGRVVDTTRMRDVLGFTPRYTTREAFDDFVARQGLRGPLSADVVQAVESKAVEVLDSVAGRTGAHA
jgi:UDP-glucose 4-epimerase